MLARFTYLTGRRKGGHEEFDADLITIGRAADNHLCLGDGERRVSSHHAEVRRKGDRYVLRDLGSTNGTMINGRRVKISEVMPDDLIEFGAGGPLVRFSVERNSSAPPGERDGLRLVHNTEPVEHVSTANLLARRLLRQRQGNVRLVAALVVAMLLGAGGGIFLASWAGPDEDGGFVAVASRNSPAVVFIRAEYELIDGAGNVTATEGRTGSGFVIDPAGLIVTNRHVVRDWDYNQPPAGYSGRVKRIEVVFAGRRPEAAIPAEIHRLAPAKETDVAILKIAPPSDMPVVQGTGEGPQAVSQGDRVVVIGYPLGLNLFDTTGDERVATSLFDGVVSRVTPEVLQLYIRAYQGNSGGPVLNRRGEVIGILTANLGGAQDIVFCTPISAATGLLEGEQSYRSQR